MDDVNTFSQTNSAIMCSHIEDEYNYHTKGQRRSIVRVASIDGGGTRGIIPAVILAEVEKILNLPISEVFDLMAGTSTGSIIATGLAIPKQPGGKEPLYTASQIVELFENESSRVFPPSYVAWMYEPFTAKYNSSGLYDVLQKYCKNFRLSESITELLIPAAEASSDRSYKPWWFTKRGILPCYKYQEDSLAKISNVPAWEIVAASASAPTYFPPKVIDFGNTQYQFMDGGTFANNPARNALTYSQKLYDSSLPHVVASFGTGFCPAPKPYSWIGNGFLYWGANFPTAALSLSAENVVADLHLEFPDWGQKQSLFIMQPTIQSKDYTLDDSSPAHMEALKEYAKSYIDDHQDELVRLCKKLVPENDLY